MIKLRMRSLALATLLLACCGVQTGPSERVVASGDAMAPIVPIYLLPSGFEPAETMLHAGAMQVMLRNRSLEDDLVFTVRRTGALMATMDPVGNHRNRRWAVDFRPGEYAITVASHPEWWCRIHVVP